jgi:hypothetical protein
MRLEDLFEIAEQYQNSRHVGAVHYANDTFDFTLYLSSHPLSSLPSRILLESYLTLANMQACRAEAPHDAVSGLLDFFTQHA